MKKVAIIGAGQVAEKVHAAYYSTQKNILELCAVVDPDIERATDFCNKTGFHNAYRSVAEMLDLESPDIVSVCTPNKFHFEAVMAALEAGASVICEKPPAMSSHEAKLMFEKAERNNLTLAYGFQHRHSHEAIFLKENLSLLGEVYYAEVNALRRSGIPGWGNFIDKEAQGGGPLIDYGIHMLDTIMYLLDFPSVKSVKAHSFQKIGTKKDSGKFGKWNPEKFTVEDSLFGTLELFSGGIIRINTSFALNIKEDSILGINLCGDIAGASLYPAEIYEDRDGELVLLKSLTKKDSDNHRISMENFVGRVLGDPNRMIADGIQGYKIQKIIEGLYQSAETGEVIYL